MKKSMIAVAVIILFCSSAFASDDCDAKYNQYINALNNTKKIIVQQKQKYIAMLEQAHKLCKQDKMTEASKVMEELKDRFFHDAVLDQHTFWGN